MACQLYDYHTYCIQFLKYMTHTFLTGIQILSYTLCSWTEKLIDLHFTLLNYLKLTTKFVDTLLMCVMITVNNVRSSFSSSTPRNENFCSKRLMEPYFF